VKDMFDIVYPGVIDSFVRAFIAPPHETGKEKHAESMCLGFGETEREENEDLCTL
jgi:hypothetical protein